MADGDDYEVGYGKPPKGTRWKPGQSGNPGGRPKKTKDFEKLLEREFDEVLRIQEGGVMRTLTKRELIAKKLVHDALKGDHRVMKLLLPYVARHQTVEGFEPDADDHQAFERLVEQLKHADGDDAPTETNHD